VRFLRSSLFIAIVSLFVVTGYGWDVLDYGCDDQVQMDHAKGQPGKKAPEPQKDGGKCICHQVFTGPEAHCLTVVPRVFAPTEYVGHTDEFPPDAVPLGIDYPPQLA
jgi:hypothetical protein